MNALHNVVLWIAHKIVACAVIGGLLFAAYVLLLLFAGVQPRVIG